MSTVNRIAQDLNAFRAEILSLKHHLRRGNLYCVASQGYWTGKAGARALQSCYSDLAFRELDRDQIRRASELRERLQQRWIDTVSAPDVVRRHAS